MPASGDSYGGSETVGEVNYYALYQQTLSSDGVWFPTNGIITSSLHIVGLESGAVLTIHCSDKPSPPDNDDHEVTKQTINGDGTEQVVAVTAPYSRYKKTKKVQGVTPTETTIYFSGAKR